MTDNSPGKRTPPSRAALLAPVMRQVAPTTIEQESHLTHTPLPSVPTVVRSKPQQALLFIGC
jgi:hypothetical protein